MTAADLAPHVEGAVIGYRVWSVRLGELVSTRKWSNNYVWIRGPQRAQCTRDRPPSDPGHPAPSNVCKCGFNAHHHLADAIARAKQFVAVVGAMRGWGQVEVHHNGFRSEFAQAIAIAFTGDEKMARLEEVADRYRIALVHISDLETVAREHGDPVDQDLWPEAEFQPIPGLMGGLPVGKV